MTLQIYGPAAADPYATCAHPGAQRDYYSSSSLQRLRRPPGLPGKQLFSQTSDWEGQFQVATVHRGAIPIVLAATRRQAVCSDALTSACGASSPAAGTRRSSTAGAQAADARLVQLHSRCTPGTQGAGSRLIDGLPDCWRSRQHREGPGSCHRRQQVASRRRPTPCVGLISQPDRLPDQSGLDRRGTGLTDRPSSGIGQSHADLLPTGRDGCFPVRGAALKPPALQAILMAPNQVGTAPGLACAPDARELKRPRAQASVSTMHRPQESSASCASAGSQCQSRLAGVSHQGRSAALPLLFHIGPSAAGLPVSPAPAEPATGFRRTTNYSLGKPSTWPSFVYKPAGGKNPRSRDPACFWWRGRPGGRNRTDLGLESASAQGLGWRARAAAGAR